MFRILLVLGMLASLPCHCATVTGNVTDISGTPIPGINVEVFINGKSFGITQTSPAGVYTLTTPPGAVSKAKIRVDWTFPIGSPVFSNSILFSGTRVANANTMYQPLESPYTNFAAGVATITINLTMGHKFGAAEARMVKAVQDCVVMLAAVRGPPRRKGSDWTIDYDIPIWSVPTKDSLCTVYLHK